MDTKGSGEIPAWMVCVDLLNKAKRELVTQAVETLEREIEEKRIDIKGNLIEVPDQPSDSEMKLFVLGQVLSNADQMRERYGEYIKSVHQKGEKANATEVEGAERARLLLMAVEKIEILTGYSTLLDQWINDASMAVDAKSPTEVLSRTISVGHRKEILSFLISNRKMKEEQIFSDGERQMMEQAVS